MFNAIHFFAPYSSNNVICYVIGLGLGLGLGFRIGLGLGLRCESALAPMKTIASFVCDFVFLQHGRQTSVF